MALWMVVRVLLNDSCDGASNCYGIAGACQGVARALLDDCYVFLGSNIGIY